MWAGSSGGAPLVAHTWVRASEKPYLAVTVSVCVGQARIKQMSNSDVRLADDVDILLAAWVLGHAEWRQFPVIGGLALRRTRIAAVQERGSVYRGKGRSASLRGSLGLGRAW